MKKGHSEVLACHVTVKVIELFLTKLKWKEKYLNEDDPNFSAVSCILWWM